ncbi:MAG: transcriptional regulator [Chloroflexi bacterium]|nr:transcriptional regulator [Chloroflexota bacterium]
MTVITREVQSQWQAIRPIFMIRNEREYNQVVARLNRLIDEISTDETHPSYALLDTLGTLIHAYEEEHYHIPECSGAEMLRFFIDEHGLTQSDLPEVGSREGLLETAK